MQPTVPSGTQRRTLDADDITGIIAIYGAAVPTLTLNQALDNAYLAFSTGGSANWFPDTTAYFYGGSAARSGAIGNSQSSWLQTTAQGPGTISFFWKVSSKANYDFLEFRIDGNLKPGKISGTVGWHQKIYAIPAGSHTLSWVYVKDAYLSIGSDCGWLDRVLNTRGGRTTSILPLLLLD